MNQTAAGYLASADPEWQYPEAGDPPAPRGTKLQLLNCDGAATMGQWTDDSNFIAWAPLLKRNKAKDICARAQIIIYRLTSGRPRFPAKILTLQIP